MSSGYDISSIELLPLNGKFYIESPSRKHLVYEVSETQFRIMMVTMYNNRNRDKEYSKTFEYLLSQLEMTGQLFQATLFDEWLVKI